MYIKNRIKIRDLIASYAKSIEMGTIMDNSDVGKYKGFIATFLLSNVYNGTKLDADQRRVIEDMINDRIYTTLGGFRHKFIWEERGASNKFEKNIEKPMVIVEPYLASDLKADETLLPQLKTMFKELLLDVWNSWSEHSINVMRVSDDDIIKGIGVFLRRKFERMSPQEKDSWAKMLEENQVITGIFPRNEIINNIIRPTVIDWAGKTDQEVQEMLDRIDKLAPVAIGYYVKTRDGRSQMIARKDLVAKVEDCIKLLNGNK